MFRINYRDLFIISLPGSGFGDDASQVSVKIASVDCNVLSATDSEIVCTVESTSSEHLIDNSGSHPKYGLLYAWNPSFLEVEVRRLHSSNNKVAVGKIFLMQIA